MTVKKRMIWGLRAGQRAYRAGKSIEENPFQRLPGMPEMHDAWIQGWRRQATRSREGK